MNILSKSKRLRKKKVFCDIKILDEETDKLLQDPDFMSDVLKDVQMDINEDDTKDLAKV